MEKIEGMFHVIKCNAINPPEGSPVNVVFLDPPYDKYHIVIDVVKRLMKNNWINEHTIVIFEFPKKHEEFYKSEFYKNINIIKEKSVSNSYFLFTNIKIQ